jgi:hypothetical protein
MRLLIWLLNMHHRLRTARRHLITLTRRKASTTTLAQYHYKPANKEKEVQPHE